MSVYETRVFRPVPELPNPLRRTLAGLIAGVLVLAGAVSPIRAAAGYEVLGSFQKPGTQVVAPLLLHSDGNFYGVASSGGAFDLGTVFKLTPAGALTTLYSFSGPDGSGPAAKLVEGTDHALYGTAPGGGANGFGVAFKVTTGGVFTKLVDFTGAAGAAPGSVPDALVQHADGNFYGVTQGGGTGGVPGAGGLGTVFKMTPSGVITSLLNFTGAGGANPGNEPQGPLAVSGTLLYGVTKSGGTAGFGVIFEVSTTGAWRSLGEFTGTAGARPGANPAAGLLLNTDGALYGTTEFGGTNGFGVVFKTTVATTPVYTSLRSFADPTGSQPADTLVRGTDGLLYGTTTNGGANGLGTVYKITTAGVHTLLASFTGETGIAPGSAMRGGLVLGAANLYYGMTSSGGPGNLGSAFKITSTGTFTTVASLSLNQGWMPSGAPVLSGTDLLFPMAGGGVSGCGNLMSLAANGTISVAAAFNSTLGSAPDGALKSAGANLYGVAAKGGATARGTMFRYTPGTGLALVSAYATSAGSLAEGPLELGADGLYYGIGREGGATSRGAIYKITTAGVRTRLVSFTGLAGAAPGQKPRGPLVLAADGNFYGLTEEGGVANTGVIYRLTATGVYSVVSAFGSTGPRSPQGGFVAAPDGFLYATTSAGGTGNFGTLIRFDPVAGTYEVAGEFSGASGYSSGELPAGELLVAPDGTIYGTTLLGGASDEGVIFRYSAAMGLQTLVEFTGLGGAAPGSAGGVDPAGLIFSGGLAFGADGLLYGVAPSGGQDGGGVVYRVTLPPPISDWKTIYLGDAEAPNLADPDADGLPNLVEYALQTDPAVADSNLAPTAQITTFPEGQRLAVSVSRDPTRSDVNITVEVSETLLPQSWMPLATSTLGNPFTGPGYFSGDSTDPGPKTVIVRDTQPVSSSIRRFIRIRAEH